LNGLYASFSQENGNRERILLDKITLFLELGLIEKNKVELQALYQLGYREIGNRENGMTPGPDKDLKIFCRKTAVSHA